MRLLIALALTVAVTADAAAKERQTKPDKGGGCYYRLTKAEKKAFPFAECFYQPVGPNGCLPITCKEQR